jgi:hypothetical protein
MTSPSPKGLTAIERRLAALEERRGATCVWLCRTAGEPLPAATERAASDAVARGSSVSWIEYVLVDPS